MPAVPRIRRAIVDEADVYRSAQGMPVVASMEYPASGIREDVEGLAIAWTRECVEVVWSWRGEQQADWSTHRLSYRSSSTRYPSYFGSADSRRNAPRSGRAGNRRGQHHWHWPQRGDADMRLCHRDSVRHKLTVLQVEPPSAVPYGMPRRSHA